MLWEGKHMKKFSYLRPFLKRIRSGIIFITLLSSGIAAVQLVIPCLLRDVFDKGISNKDVNVLVRTVVILIVLYVVSSILKIACNFSFTKVSNTFVLEIQKDVYNRVMNMPLEFFDENETGYIMERLNEVNNLNLLFSPMVMDIMISSISFVGAIIMIATMNLELLIFVVVCMPLLYLLSNFSVGKIRRTSEEYSEASADTAGNVEESINGIRELKGLNVEDKRVKELHKKIQNVSEKAIRRGKSTVLGSEMIGLFANVSNAIFTLIVGLLILKDSLSIGAYMALSVYIGQVFSPIQQFSMMSLSIQPGLVTLSRLGIFLDNKMETEVDGSEIINQINEISFQDTSFKYPKTQKTVINKLSFQVKRGEKIVVLGENGSGKSTIAKLLLGFYRNYQGKINFNGVELRDINIHSLRERIGIVSQHIFLFAGSIKENILLGIDQYDEDELSSIIQVCGLEELVNENKGRGPQVLEGASCII